MRNKSFTSAFILLALIFISPIFTKSCANVSSAPSGGPKDTIPPELVSCEPLYNALNVPTQGKHCMVVFNFNEYVQVKDAMKNIFLSPPQQKAPEYKIKGKSVIITFKEPLDSNTTYSLDLGQAISDNNENNPFPKFVHSFSTGSQLDTMFVSGTVSNALTMLPEKEITVLFHRDTTDSAVFNRLPSAAARTDIWGYFTVRNLKPSKYRVYAIQDINNNNKYDPETDMIAFLDSLVIPDKPMVLDMPELAVVDIKDTLTCLSRPSQIQLLLFKEMSTKQFLRDRERPLKRMFFLKFAAPYVQIDSISVKGLSKNDLLIEKNVMGDSLNVWLMSPKADKDTITVIYKYMMTDDSLQILVPVWDTLKMAPPKPKLTKDKRGNAVEVVDSIGKYVLTATPETVEQEGFHLEFDTPLSVSCFDSIKLKCIDIKQNISYQKIIVEQDSTCIRKYTIRPETPFVIGNEYTLKFPHRLFKDIYGLPMDSIDVKVALPNDDNLSSMSLDLRNINTKYIVQLINEARDKTFRTYRVQRDTTLLFPYLSKGRYSIKITEDKNGNGLLDTGNLLNHEQPEKVLLFKFSDKQGNDAYITDVPERMDMEQTIDIAEMFK